MNAFSIDLFMFSSAKFLFFSPHFICNNTNIIGRWFTNFLLAI